MAISPVTPKESTAMISHATGFLRYSRMERRARPSSAKDGKRVTEEGTTTTSSESSTAARPPVPVGRPPAPGTDGPWT